MEIKQKNLYPLKYLQQNEPPIHNFFGKKHPIPSPRFLPRVHLCFPCTSRSHKNTAGSCKELHHKKAKKFVV